MFSSLLRRPRSARRRVRDHLDPQHEPSSVASASFGNRRRATADFTEADDDEDHAHEDDEEAAGHGMSNIGRTARFEDDNHGYPDADDDEDGRLGALPVLPLFSVSHLGSCSPLDCPAASP